MCKFEYRQVFKFLSTIKSMFERIREVKEDFGRWRYEEYLKKYKEGEAYKMSKFNKLCFLLSHLQL